MVARAPALGSADVHEKVAASWNVEYAAGRYRDEPPVGFIQDILAAACRHGLTRGLYIGCGNGRNLIPLLTGGLDLLGLDISTEAITQLRQQRPDRVDHLIVGDVSALPARARYELVIGIQVFQHGNRHQTHQHLADAAARVAPGGLLCVRVNSTDSHINHGHHRFEDNDDGFTLRYLAGSKTGLNIPLLHHRRTARRDRHVLHRGTPTTPSQHPTNPTRPRPVVTMGSDLATTTRLQLISEPGAPEGEMGAWELTSARGGERAASRGCGDVGRGGVGLASDVDGHSDRRRG
jgi:SAM-dependent methyltransferase